MSIYVSIQNINFEVYKATQVIGSDAAYHVMSYVVESYLIVLPLIMIYMVYKKDKNVFSFALAGLVFYLIGDILKKIIQEPRPCALSGIEYMKNYCDTGYSFPSNHATVLTGLALFINYKYLRALYILWVILLLFSKVFLAQHYFTDIIAGIIISLVVGRIVQVYSKKINDFFSSIFNRVFGRIYKF
jgi:undecaprenyl-diphosphatase